mgnify:CR=1 FL=1
MTGHSAAAPDQENNVKPLDVDLKIRSLRIEESNDASALAWDGIELSGADLRSPWGRVMFQGLQLGPGRIVPSAGIPSEFRRLFANGDDE